MTIRFKGHCGQDPNMPVLPENPPNMKRAGPGKWEGPCPFQGGNNRLQMVEGKRIWCRHCNTIKYLDNATFTPTAPAPYVYSVPTQSLLDQDLAAKFHKALTKEHRAYFHGRGINDEWIDRAQLGWKEEWRRYSIPCFQNGILYAMQHRRSSDKQEKRYISETNSWPDLLYGGEDFKARKLMYVVIVEAPLDRLALESHGFPAVARFCGNNQEHPWHKEFNPYIANAIDKIIVSDNDENQQGLLYAELKRVQIPGSRVVTPKLKDIGQYYEKGRDAEVSAVLGVPALRRRT